MSWTEALIALSLKVRHLIAGDIVILFSSEGGESRFSLYSFFPLHIVQPALQAAHVLV